MELQIIYLKPDELTPYEHNAKQHPEKQIQHIAKSIREFGFRQPIVADADNVVVIGHGRLMAAKALGLDSVPVVRADDLTDEQIRALRLADNKTNESEWDLAELETELAKLEMDFDMSEFGFSDTSAGGFTDTELEQLMSEETANRADKEIHRVIVDCNNQSETALLAEIIKDNGYNPQVVNR